MLGMNCRPSTYSCPSPSCQSGEVDIGFLLSSILNISPRFSSYFNPLNLNRRRTLSEKASLSSDSDKALPSTSTSTSTSLSSVSSNDTHTTPKSCAELKEEIETLELQIMHLERHLLSLYRTAFEGQIATTLPTTPSTTGTGTGTGTGTTTTSSSSSSSSSSSMTMATSSLFKKDISFPKSSSILDLQSPFPRPPLSPTPFNHTPKPTPTPEQKVSGSGPRSLADHLGSSSIVNNLKAPDRLSEDIVRCVSSIYCKLANPPQPQSHAATLSASPSSSLSSSTVFSSRNPGDSWSPRYNDDNATSHHALQDDSGPYASMIQVLKIRLDNATFIYAAKMLQHFRALIKTLEKVDPRKMKREEKLSFWINIHNALLMHAYLAYGSGNRVKTPSVLKAAYNVGGQYINAYVIQSSILGIRSHNSAPWLQTLLPGRKFKARSIRHEYALEYPEPLVHFALCSGEYFDPAVRAYTAKSIFGDLKMAKEEFMEANVHIEKERKIVLPRVVYYFAKDMSLSTEEVLEVIVESLSESEVEKRDIITRCITKGGSHKCIHWLPHSSTFRFFIHPDLAA